MLYGLSCAINDVLWDKSGKVIIVYIDDILIYSPCLEEHIKHVKQVLSCLLENQLYIKAEKCEIHDSKICFLGYIISMERVTMDTGKVPAVTT